ncbi:ferrochelatase [Chitinilyticum piscinae]|uniref:Ferrochelatase n=1 Tax=Chitinilyticum piscinae TaxID=2866724 RepID=A0A8J7K266_9NEIS|nr:ferrochelatase [Chitinilyticum piscinae]MBE9609607.1 ferrochelatase [Chitinilyticum piscinae]
MSRFAPEPEFSHGQPTRTGVLVVNLGTPAAPTSSAIRPWLREFLSDPRVVELPRALWLPILHGFILPFRPGKTAHKYASIWSKDGSPLAIWTEKQGKLLKGWLGERHGDSIRIAHAMRYGSPSIETGIHQLRQSGCERILILPLYPQYSASTTATVIDEAARVLATLRNQPALRTLRGFHDDPGYIKALAQSVQRDWMTHGRGNHLLMSFHGVPRYTLDKGDPYHCLCLKTARLLATELGLAEGSWSVAFQSRFGKAEWLKPYTSTVISELAKKKIGRLDVICPGFVSDCLETLEEIALEGKADFLAAGGSEYHFIPCLNDAPEWIHALGMLAERELSGWLTDGKNASAQKNLTEQTLLRAKAMGASK